ncbi:MAG: SDR family oxidoreductase [Desulfobacteraceae bacterium]|nr:SDR family oxidoreductase [Desulfobacteraceae bacterium]
MLHYFLTGATGAIGSAFLMRIASRQAPITLLLRATTREEANARLQKLLNFLNLDPNSTRHIEALPGDLQLPSLGMQPNDYDRVAKTCTHLVHCAGNVYMNLPLEQARQQTLTMTSGILALLQSSSRACKLELVSTVGVGGHTQGEIPEAWIDHPRAFHNSYEAAKAEAEQLVREKIQAGLPITVHRPSMVVGDSQTGRTIAFQVFYYLCEFLSGARTQGWLPQVGKMRLDIVPADYVAEILDWSSQKGNHTRQILHSCSGAQGAIPLRILIERIREIFRAHGRRLPATKLIPLPLFQLLLGAARPLIAPRHRRALDALPFFFAYLKEDQTFANSQTLRLLEADGIHLPKVEEYLENILHYYLTAAGKPKL